MNLVQFCSQTLPLSKILFESYPLKQDWIWCEKAKKKSYFLENRYFLTLRNSWNRSHPKKNYPFFMFLWSCMCTHYKLEWPPCPPGWLLNHQVIHNNWVQYNRDYTHWCNSIDLICVYTQEECHSHYQARTRGYGGFGEWVTSGGARHDDLVVKRDWWNVNLINLSATWNPGQTRRVSHSSKVGM